MTLQGPHQVAKQSRIMREGSERAVRKSVELVGVLAGVMVGWVVG